MIFEIKHRYSGNVLFSNVLFSLETDSLKLCVEAAIKSGAKLSGADLSGADLYGANLYGYISIGPIGSRKSYLWARWENKKYIVHTGCFSGTLEEFEDAVKNTHKKGEHLDEYLLAIKLSERRSQEGATK